MNDQELEALQLLETMLRIPSVSGSEGPLAAFLVERMAQLGFEARVDEAGNAIGIAGEGPLTAVLLGHIDTVPGDLPIYYQEGRLYGRGAVDAKGPMAAFIASVSRLLQEGPLPLRVIIIGCVEEEVASSKGAHHVLPLYKPDCCIVGEPSGWDRITLGYKGALRADFRLEQGSSHTAHANATAPEQAVQVWNRIATDAMAFNAGKERLFDQLMPALVHIGSGGDGKTDWAELGVNFRLPPEMPPGLTEEWLKERAAGCRVRVQGAAPAWAGSRTTPLHRALTRAIRSQGGEAKCLLKTGTADLNLVGPAWGCPALAYGPGDAALDHTPEEHMVVEEFLKGIAVLKETLKNFAGMGY